MRIPNYVFDTRLYEGEHTLVFAGVSEIDGKPVVGKMVTGGARDLRAELALLKKLEGPGVVEVQGLFDSSEGPVLVQRRFGDGSLGHVLRTGPLPLERTLRVGLAIAEVLGRIHAARVLHRDIKPDNVLFDTQTDAIAVADFGVAIELPMQARVLPVYDLVGTPAYISPEQTGRTGEGVDARSDLYSFGITLYQLLTGTLPFESHDMLELVSAHLSKVAEPPSLRNPKVPAVVSAIVMKLIAKAKDQRYQSARGVAVDLARCLHTMTQEGAIPTFELGRSDLVRPRVTQALYGRDAERAQFLSAHAKAVAGTPTLVLVSGREGSGRSGFVRELLRTAASTSPAAIGGWKGTGDRPLAGISEALASLSQRLLLLDDARLEALRARIKAKVGQVGQVLIDIAPELLDVLGPQPPLAELGPAEARARLRHAFRSFALALGAEQPLVMSLSNVDFADAASLTLIESLLEPAEDGRVLVVLSARDQAIFGALSEHPAATAIDVGPISLEALTQWTSALLDTPPAKAAELAEVLHERSAGHPGVFLSYIEHFIDTHVIERSEGAFTWSMERVRAAKGPASAGALAAQRVSELSAELRAVLAAVVCGDRASGADALAVMAQQDVGSVGTQLSRLTREGLVEAVKEGGYAVTHEAIAQSVLAGTGADDQAAMRARLGQHILRTTPVAELPKQAFRIASALGERGASELEGEERRRAAALYALAADQATAVMAYQSAAEFAARGDVLLGADGWTSDRTLSFRLAIGLARSSMMLGQHDRAEQILEGLCARDLTADEMGIVYPSRCDNRSVVMDRLGAIKIGLEGLERLGFPLPAEPTQQEAFAPLAQNQQILAKMTLEDHVSIPLATDAGALAAQRIISTLSGPLTMAGKPLLYLLSLESALALNLKFGHTPYYASLLGTHALLLHSRLGNFDAARMSAAACQAVQRARPAPEIDGRTFLVLYYLIFPWFEAWRKSQEPLARGIQLAVEAGDPLFAALSASATVTLMAMCGDPYERMVAFIESNAAVIKADAGVAVNAGNVLNLAGKLSRGEPIEQADLDRVTNVSKAAGAMRNNAMVNFALALMAVGHEAQVRSWFEEVRVSFPQVNPGQPHLATVWLIDGLLGAKDAQRGQLERLSETERALASLRKLDEQTKSGNHQPAILLLEAEMARARAELDRASGLYGRAASEARARELTHVVAYAMEQRADMLAAGGYADEAALFYRESVIAYRRWGHVTKVQLLEQAHPTLKTLEASRAGSRSGTRQADPARTQGTVTKHITQGTVTRHATHGTKQGTTGATQGSINDALDLGTVLKISQEISTQLRGSDVVRTVLLGIAQNAGAERVLFILRSADGDEVVYGEVQEGHYRDLGTPLASYAALPHSVLRLAKRTARPLMIADASSDAAHASDAFVAEARCRSVAVIPITRKGEVGGYVVLENRLMVGAFTPSLVSLTQSLVAQAAISLDNASLYENMEQRVRERTAALNARNEEMRLVLDNVSQGLVMADRDGKLSNERSAVLARWFAEGVPDTLAGIFEGDGTFGMSWEQLLEGFMPLELCLDQLPKHLRRGEQILELGWQPILDDAGELTRMLLVMSDITEALRRQEAEQEQKEMMAIFERLSTDRGSVVDFAREATNIVRELERARGTNETEKRLVHTLKGNAALFGLGGLSSLCHDVESAMVLDDRGLLPEERAEIVAAWQAISSRLGRFLNVGGNYVQVARQELEAALRALVREGSTVAQDLELWKLETMESRFHRLGEQAQALAQRLGKAPVAVQIEHANIRINGDAWAPVWASFVHAVRNAVDHGLETPEERAELGKGVATLRLRAYFSGPSLMVEFSDDGRGINWERVREKARAAGLAAETHEHLVEALFSDGMSTKDEADEHSGRGVGMSALREACEALGATMSVESSAGKGTTYLFAFPGHLARLPRERRPSLTPSMYPAN